MDQCVPVAKIEIHHLILQNHIAEFATDRLDVHIAVGFDAGNHGLDHHRYLGIHHLGDHAACLFLVGSDDCSCFGKGGDLRVDIAAQRGDGLIIGL